MAWASDMPPLPVMAGSTETLPNFSEAWRSTSASVSWMWAKWRRYSLYRIAPTLSRMATLTVVEPTSIPNRYSCSFILRTSFWCNYTMKKALCPDTGMHF